MPEQRTQTVGQEESMTDAGILVLLLGDDTQRPWSVDEIARQIGDPIATHDSLRRLQAAGLAHRLDRFVWASRAALVSEEIRL
jgi:hypothetical protein